MLAPQIPDELAHLADLLRIETDRRLVEDQDRRVVQERLGQPHPLPVPLGEMVDDAAANVADAAAPHDVVEPRADLGARHTLQTRAETEILLDAHFAVERDALG